MQALVLQLALICSMPAILISPHVGILIYYWYTWFNPHQIVYGTLDLPWAKIIAGVTIFSWIISKESKKIPLNNLNIFIILFFMWTIVTTLTARYPIYANEEFFNWTKIALIALISSSIMHSKLRLHAWIWIVCLSIGYFGVRGGMFTLLSGGNTHVLGPPKSSIFDTNEISRAFMMTLPMMYYLTLYSKHQLVRVGVAIMLFLTVIAILGTTSRTVFVTLGFMGILWWFRSKHKVRLAVIGILAIAIGFTAIPAERISALSSKYSTIEDYEVDNSFQSRVAIWEYAKDLAQANPLTGGGFKAVVHGYGREPHSNYFQVLGEHGFVGLILYTFIIVFAILYSFKIMRRTSNNPDWRWAYDLAFMLQLSIVGYAIAGITKNHAFFELYYMILAMLVSLDRLVITNLPSKNFASQKRNRSKGKANLQRDNQAGG